MRVEPFGSMREDYRIGTLWSLVANMFGRRKGDPAIPWHEPFPEHKPGRVSRRPGALAVWQSLSATARAAGLFRDGKG